MSMVSISPQTVKKARIRKGYRTQEEAVAKTSEIDDEGDGLSARQWSRIEAAKKPLVQVRRGTAELIAKTLGMAEVEELAKPPADDGNMHNTMQEAGYRRIAVWLGNDVRQNYRWVTHHYDVSATDLIDAAPWMFTLLAEMSLADRKRRLKDAETSFEDAMANLPTHLGHGSVARSDFESAVSDENNSLLSRDVYGKKVLEGAATGFYTEPFNPDETNPFFDFLRRAAETMDSHAIDPELLDLPYGGGMPRWPIFESWLEELTDGDYWARFAVENVTGIVDAIPENLKGKEKAVERVQWLIEQIPAEMKALEEERRAKLEAKLAEITL